MELVVFLKIFPPEIATVILAMLPVFELRGSIPLALAFYGLEPFAAYILSVVGSVIPAFFILWLLGPLSGYLMERFSWMHRFFSWLFARTRHKFTGKYQRFGELALIIFVAIPLPITGVWTGSVAAFLFGIPKKRALVLLTIGSVIAGIIVSLLSLGVLSAFSL